MKASTIRALFGELRGPASRWPTELESVVRWYRPHLARLHDDAPVREGDLAQLAHIASTYPSRERFLTEMALDPPEATSDRAGVALKDDDYLILSTIHSAKGQEWKSVQVLNVVDGCIPSDMSTSTTEEIEEERRLLYVAMTRAKEELALLVPQRFHVQQQAARGDRHVYASRSRFIPDALTAHFEASAWPAPAPPAERGNAGSDALPAVDIAARIRSLWR
jgi:DNA helicase-2/ATP-dependent DNA helicase PcrA